MKHPRVNVDSEPSVTDGWIRPGMFSLLIHIALVVFLLINLKTPVLRHPTSVYRVSILRLGTGTPPGGVGPVHLIPGGGSPQTPSAKKPMALESSKKVEVAKRRKVIEAIRRDQKKLAKKAEPEKREVPLYAKKTEKKDIETKTVTGLKSSSHKEERPKPDSSDKSLRDALAEIQRKVALDELRKRIEQRGTKEKVSSEGLIDFTPSQGSTTWSSKRGTGVGPGMGRGGSPWGSVHGTSEGSLLDAYYTMLWGKIKAGWTLPENLSKGGADLETVIVVIVQRDGKIQKSWFEKKSGNSLYDQMAIRAIKKAEPLPSIPKEFSDDTFEIGIRFHPD